VQHTERATVRGGREEEKSIEGSWSASAPTRSPRHAIHHAGDDERAVRVVARLARVRVHQHDGGTTPAQP
jgi:hypothetical protein